MGKPKIVMDSTNNSRVYNMARKRYLKNKGLISCDICPYHRGENVKINGHHRRRNWKLFRKTQYKEKSCET